MRKILIALALVLPALAAAQCTSKLVSSGVYGTAQGASGNAQYVLYMPQPSTCYNGIVLLYAHGYVAVGSPSGTWLSQLQLPDGSNIPAIANSLGFGFAASSYSKDGLAILQGIQDTRALINVFHDLSIPVQNVFITGASEGGLVTAKSIEADPSYSGGVAVCGPIGSFRQQVNYLGDARVLFDYFFPGVLGKTPWSPNNITIPAELMADWTSIYAPAIRNAVNANPLATFQFLITSNITVGLNFANAADAIVAAIWYNVFATNDARATLRGNPYDNIGHYYQGSLDDVRLNASVARFAVDSAAVVEMSKYETDGVLINPLVTLHTTADPVVPYWHETLYQAKVQSHNKLANLNQLPAFAFGHCNVNAGEAELALGLMILNWLF
jgi:hypothetical protein